MRSFWLQRRVIGAVMGGLVVTLSPSPSRAQVPSYGPQIAHDAPADAPHEHFNRALELYRAGQYAEALEHLERAAELDPNGKDLFFNLALVHEKLGQLSEAMAALERFRELEPDPGERERARLSIERLRGAQQAAKVAQPATPSCPQATTPPPAVSRPTGVMLGAASVAVVSVVVGTIFGVKALSDDVKGTPTSAALPLAQLRERGRRAEREALVSDVAFALGAASAGLFAGLWWLAPTESARSAGITLGGYF